MPRLLESHGESNDGTSARIAALTGETWTLRRRSPADNGTLDESTVALPFPDPPPLGALQLQLAGFMARRVGACRHYHFLYDGTWARLALRVEGEETVELPTGRRAAWAAQRHTDGGPHMRSWIDEDGRLLRIDFGAAYGGAWMRLAERAEATAGLNPSIRVR